MNKFMVGTKFYRHIGVTEVPEIIRLRFEEGNILYFENGGYEATITKEEYEKMVQAKELNNICENEFNRRFDYFGYTMNQKWTCINSITDDFIKFKVDGIGIKMTYRELMDNYIRLIPDGFFTISNISYPINEGKERGYDVFCTLHKGKETQPYVICRQDIADVFKYSSSEKMINIGLSISRRTCPKNMDFEVFSYSENIKDFKAVAIYLDDSISTIFKYIGSINRYNLTLRRLRDKYNGTNMVGCTDNLYDMLHKNGFYNDFKETFGVFTYPFALDMSRSIMNDRETNMFNSIIKIPGIKRMTNLIYCPYDKGIDMDEIDKNHLLINIGDDKHSEVFIVIYDIEE